MLKPVLFSLVFLGLGNFVVNSATVPVYLTETPQTRIYGRCITPHREYAFCIQLDDCKYLYNYLATSQLSSADKLFFRRSQCGYQSGKILICCPDRYRLAATVTTLSKTPTATATVNHLLPKPGECGNVLTNRIYGGNVTKIDEFPWMALIEYTKSDGTKVHHCGGSLISARYVVTAAHCVSGQDMPADWTLSAVRLGEWDTSTAPDCEVDVRGHPDCSPPHLDIAVTRIIPHPQYASVARSNDIALLRLEHEVAYTDFVRPICLPVNPSLRSATFDGVDMDVAGWGQTERASASPLKLKATVKGVSLEKCRKVYGKQTPSILLEESQICAVGKKGVDSCRGDSGGPIVSLATSNYMSAHYFLVGVVSFGPEPCGLPDWPGVYTRVSYFVDWIQRTIEE